MREIQTLLFLLVLMLFSANALAAPNPGHPLSQSYINGTNVTLNQIVSTDGPTGNIPPANSQLNANYLCINGVCRNTWPAGGGAGVTSVGAGDGLTGIPNPILNNGSLSLNTTAISACTNSFTQKIVWDSVNKRLACATDQDTGATAPSGNGTPNRVAKWTTPNTLGTGLIIDDGTLLGIGTTSALAALNIETSPSTRFALRTNTSGTTTSVQVNAQSGYGVESHNNAPVAAAVYGSNNANGPGVQGHSQSGTGVYGSSAAPAGAGVIGQTANASGFGVKGQNPNNYGVYCEGLRCGGTTAWTSASDARLKKNIQTIENALDKVEQLRGVTFQWNNSKNTGPQMGFIAQEVLPVAPEIVSKDPRGYYALQTAQLNALLVEAVKEQQRTIERQQTQIDALQNAICQITPTHAACAT